MTTAKSNTQRVAKTAEAQTQAASEKQAEDAVNALAAAKTAEAAAKTAEAAAPEPAQAEAVQELKPWLGKYEKKVAARGGDVEKMPEGFKYSGVKLTVGANRPKKETSVMGRIYAHVQANKGITGADLMRWMQGQRWDGHPTAYGKGGKVCADWCVGYVNGAVRKKQGHLEPMAGEAVTETK